MKRYGFKGSRGCMYKTDKKVYIRVLYLIAESKRLVISVHVKNYSYDNFFWRIMNMRENESQGDSFRANGAFISPGILIKKIIHEFTEGYLEQLEGIVDENVWHIAILENLIKQKKWQSIGLSMGIQEGSKARGKVFLNGLLVLSLR